MSYSPFSELRDRVAALTAETDQAQSMIDDARKMPYLAPSTVRDLDKAQIKLNVQRAELRNLRSQLDIFTGAPLKHV